MRKQSEAGFTLIEALVAMIILVFGIIAVSNLIVVSIQSNRLGSTSTVTTEMAAETMERLKALPFLDLKAGGDLLVDKGTVDCGGTMAQIGTAACVEPAAGCVVGGNFNYMRCIPGVSAVKTRWTIAQVNNQTFFIRVRSEAVGLGGARSRAEFTSFRSCTAVTTGCPPP